MWGLGLRAGQGPGAKKRCAPAPTLPPGVWRFSHVVLRLLQVFSNPTEEKYRKVAI